MGFSKEYTLYSDGCLVFCIAEMAGISPIEVNERFKTYDAFGYYQGEKCLVRWDSIHKAIPWLSDGIRVRRYENDRVVNTIMEQGSCIVCVDYDGNPRTVGDHFVLFKGNQEMYDPLGGKIKKTSTYPLLKGYAIIEVGKKDDPLQELKSQIGTYKNQIESYKTIIKSLGVDKTKLEAEIKGKDKEIKRLRDLVVYEKVRASKYKKKFIERRTFDIRRNKSIKLLREVLRRFYSLK